MLELFPSTLNNRERSLLHYMYTHPMAGVKEITDATSTTLRVHTGAVHKVLKGEKLKTRKRINIFTRAGYINLPKLEDLDVNLTNPLHQLVYNELQQHPDLSYTEIGDKLGYSKGYIRVEMSKMYRVFGYRVDQDKGSFLGLLGFYSQYRWFDKDRLAQDANMLYNKV